MNKEKIYQNYMEILNSPDRIEFIDEQTDDMCKISVSFNGKNLRFVQNKTYDICELAVKSNGMALEFVPREIITYDLCWYAVSQNGRALQFVPNRFKTDKLICAAVEQDPYAIRYIESPSGELCRTAVCLNPFLLCFIKEQTPEIVKEAIARTLKVNRDITIAFVKDPSMIEDTDISNNRTSYLKTLNL